MGSEPPQEWLQQFIIHAINILSLQIFIETEKHSFIYSAPFHNLQLDLAPRANQNQGKWGKCSTVVLIWDFG